MRKTAWITLDGCIAGPSDKMEWLRGDAQMMVYEQSLVDAAAHCYQVEKLQRFFELLAATRSRSGTRAPPHKR